MGKHLSDAALMGEMVAMFGVSGTATLMGWATAAVVFNAQTGAEFVAMPFGGLSSRYRRLADFRRFGDHLRAKGYDLDEGDARVPARVVVARL
jgi:hypothetical protein